MTSLSKIHDLECQIVDWLREARFDAGKTLYSLSTTTGIPSRRLQALEMGLEPLQAAHMLLIEDALGCGLPVFLTGKEIIKPVDDNPTREEVESQFEACLSLLLTLSQRSELDQALTLLSAACESKDGARENVSKLSA